jgi:subtilisin family serine protease
VCLHCGVGRKNILKRAILSFESNILRVVMVMKCFRPAVRSNISWIFLLFAFFGCANLNSPERFLRGKGYEGKLIETNLSNEELTRQGATVVKRFVTLPKIVQILGYDRSIAGTSLEESSELQNLIASNSKQELRKREGSSIFEDPSDEGDSSASLEEDLAPVTVAIIDSGVAPVTAPIKERLVGDFNFTESLNPLNWRDHGTAIASLLVGIEQKGLSVQAYAPNSRIVSIKIEFSGDSSPESDSHVSLMQLAMALDRAIESGAKIVNLSFSYLGNVPNEIVILEKALLSKAAKSGVLFVAAAGNEARSLDTFPLYPARYDLENLIVVGNHTRSQQKSIQSNYGHSVDLSALGEFVPLNTVHASVDFFSGTSFSVPKVVAALARSMGIFPNMSWKERRELLLHSTIGTRDDATQFGILNTKQFLSLIERKAVHFRGQSKVLPRKEEQLWVPNQ